MDNDNIKLAHESITSIVRSAIEKGNLTPEQIGSLTRELKNLFLPEVTVLMTNQELDGSQQENINPPELGMQPAEASVLPSDEKISRSKITYQELKEGRGKNEDYFKAGAIILDPESTFNDEYIICLEDLVQKKMLTSYLKTHFNMTVEQYKEKWGLPQDYPMLIKKLKLARSMNGKKRKKIP